MKKIISSAICAAAIACLASCESDNKNPLSEGNKSFVLKGTLKNVSDRFIYLNGLDMEAGRWLLIDSVKPNKDGEYQLKANNVQPDFYALVIQDTIQQSIIADNAEIGFDADVKNYDKTKVFKYSKANKAILVYNASINQSVEAIKNISLAANKLAALGKLDSIAPLQKQYEAEGEKIKIASKKYIMENIPSLSVFTLFEQFNFEKDFGFLDTLNQRLQAELPNSKYTKMFARQFEKAKKMREVALAGPISNGKTAPNFDLPTADGKIVSLKDYQGKYVLVDFWASWCKPCRAENPNMVNLYNKYKGKNFEILGVSLDESMEAWQKAVAEDQLPWTHVSDLKVWESLVVPLYGIQGIPFTCLIDPKGIIVAVNLRGKDLESKIAELIK